MAEKGAGMGKWEMGFTRIVHWAFFAGVSVGFFSLGRNVGVHLGRRFFFWEILKGIKGVLLSVGRSVGGGRKCVKKGWA